MTETNETLVTIATYNEIENLPTLVEEVFNIAPNVDLLVVDDNSSDGTCQWVDRKSREDSRVQCLHRERKLGVGTAVIAGMKYAIKRDYRYVLNLDADFSHHPRYIPEMISGMEEAVSEKIGGKAADVAPVDVMIGSRYVQGGRIEGWPPMRYLMSRAVNLYARWVLWLDPKDCSGGFRCYRTETLARLDLDSVGSRGYSFFEEILWLLKRQGARFRETPIVFIDRQKGRSKINLKEVWAAMRILLALGMRNLFRC